MDRQTFELEMMRAKAMEEHGSRPDYWQAFQRGLNRRFHGKNFGTDEEHKLWMSFVDSDDSMVSQRGQGYRDGFLPDYCNYNEGNCSTCPLANHGLDCRNNPIS